MKFQVNQSENQAPWYIQISVFLFLVVIFIGASRNAETPLPDNGIYKSITHDNYDITITYPTKWRVYTYSEDGSLSDDDEKLKLSTTKRATNDISIYYREAVNPTLLDVRYWDAQERINQILTIENLTEYHDTVNNVPVFVRKFQFGGYTREHVYFARKESMVAIVLGTKTAAYPEWKEEFDKVVNSFSPSE